MANKYLNSELSNYSSTWIPPLKTTNHQEQEELTTENATKAEALAKVFFPPQPAETIIPDYAYPEPLKVWGYFSRDDICKAIKKLKAYKAPGEDRIQNVVIQKCVDTIIDYLYYIYRAILKLDEYPSHWLIILTIVLRKAGKVAYNVAKSYHPIGLLNTLGKLFSALVVADISYIAEKHNLNQGHVASQECSTNTISQHPGSISQHGKRAPASQYEIPLSPHTIHLSF